MDTTKTSGKNKADCDCEPCRHARNDNSFRMLVAVLVALVLFILGLGTGIAIIRHNQYPVLAPRMTTLSYQSGGQGYMLTGSGSGMAASNPVGQSLGAGLTRVFGTISGISGNQITVMDNAGKPQTILSEANTVILSPVGEIGLSSLKPGENVSADGNLQNNRLTAKTIIVR